MGGTLIAHCNEFFGDEDKEPHPEQKTEKPVDIDEVWP